MLTEPHLHHTKIRSEGHARTYQVHAVRCTSRQINQNAKKTAVSVVGGGEKENELLRGEGGAYSDQPHHKAGQCMHTIAVIMSAESSTGQHSTVLHPSRSLRACNLRKSARSLVCFLSCFLAFTKLFLSPPFWTLDFLQFRFQFFDVKLFFSSCLFLLGSMRSSRFLWRRVQRTACT